MAELCNWIGLNEQELDELRRIYREDPSPTRFIHRIVARDPRVATDLHMVMFDVFRFGTSPLNTLGGWWQCNDRNKLSDERFNESMTAHIDAHRQLWDKSGPGT
jgi:hypothetical protein